MLLVEWELHGDLYKSIGKKFIQANTYGTEDA